jgi:uncharacterized membrane protein
MSKTRFEAFSDGVFAFAITLLVLGFAIPFAKDGSHLTDGALAGALLAMWANGLAYVLSFAVIGIMWQNHHALFRLVSRVDRKTVALNLLLLMFTVFIPFATQLLGAYKGTHSATFLYGALLTCCSTAYNLLLAHLCGSKAFRSDVTDATLRQTIVAYRVGWATYVCATLVSLVWPQASAILYGLITIYYIIPRGVDSDLNAAG